MKYLMYGSLTGILGIIFAMIRLLFVTKNQTVNEKIISKERIKKEFKTETLSTIEYLRKGTAGVVAMF